MNNKNIAGIDAGFKRSMPLDERCLDWKKGSRGIEEAVLKQYGLNIQFVIYGLFMPQNSR